MKCLSIIGTSDELRENRRLLPKRNLVLAMGKTCCPLARRCTHLLRHVEGYPEEILFCKNEPTNQALFLTLCQVLAMNLGDRPVPLPENFYNIAHVKYERYEPRYHAGRGNRQGAQ